MQNQELQWLESVHILRNFMYWVMRQNEMLQSFCFNYVIFIYFID